MKEKTTIVIPNYNGLHFLKPCMKALQTKGNEAQVILVDNGSTDGSVSYIKKNYPEVSCICFEENQGFCEAVNAGIKASDTPYVLLLNNDTEVLEDFVQNLEAAIEAKPSIFSVSAQMLMLQQPETIDGAGDYYCALGWAFAGKKGKNKQTASKRCKVFSACGGAALYRKVVFDEIGLFDTSHFAYLEDLDVGYRAQIYGYENWYEPKAKVLHAGSGSSGSRYNEFKTKMSSRNNILVIYKNMPLLQILINSPFLLAGFLIKIAFFIKKGYGTVYVHGLRQGIKDSWKKQTNVDRVHFKVSNVGNYCKIQLQLWINIAKRFLY